VRGNIRQTQRDPIQGNKTHWERGRKKEFTKEKGFCQCYWQDFRRARVNCEYLYKTRKLKEDV
jgi:hypothetical protein